ncbi:MAG: type II secretion system protein GspG [Verrucomicrobiota bacterium]|jgi:hypothetical protein|nr:type II secretion system protein GspG [Verrucomicrobiota bacterium]
MRSFLRKLFIFLGGLTVLAVAIVFVGARLVFDHDHRGVREVITAASAATLEQAVQIYADTHNGQFPGSTREEIISTLTTDDGEKPALLKESAAFDPWGTPYELQIDASQAFHVRSAGPDGVMSNRDDLVFTTQFGQPKP